MNVDWKFIVSWQGEAEAGVQSGIRQTSDSGAYIQTNILTCLVLLRPQLAVQPSRLFSTTLRSSIF